MGIFVLGSTVFSHVSPNEVVEQTEDQDTESISELTVEAVPSAGQVSIERNSYLIKILPETEEPKSEEVIEENYLPSPAKVFKILFEHILSTNSP